MPTQHEYRAAATTLRSNSAALVALTDAAQQLLPATEIDGPFRDFFESSLAESHSVGQWTQGGLEGAAAECDRRAEVCEQYTQDMRAHLAVPDYVDEPTRPAPWAEAG